jgi:preprotein translocase subunit SecF
VLQLLTKSNFDFMRRGRLVLAISGMVMLASVVVLSVRGLNLGIEFTGGTELQVKYSETPDVAEIRAMLTDAGLTSQSVTTIGDPADNEIYIRIGTETGGADAELITRVTRTLRGTAATDGFVDLNVADRATTEELLRGAPSLGGATAEELSAAISALRKDVAIFSSVDDVSVIPTMTPQALEYLRTNAQTGPIAIRSQSYIFPAVGKELTLKAGQAILMSLIMMLLYIWVRFQLQWGLGAVLALAHDTLITLGLFSLFQKEMSLPVVAAFLTLVGYSVNDTVVVFDRIRENLWNRVGRDLPTTVNISINQTLSRTVITSALTWIVVFGLFVFGGPALNAFAFVLCVGVVVGTYSSIYIASPFIVIWKEYSDRRKARSLGAEAASRPSRKVRTTS